MQTKIKYSALLIFLITAYFSIGFFHPDEYFQIFEFAQYKFGNIGINDLPWEFAEKMRPSLQPWIAYVAIKSLNFIHITNPFTIVAIIRGITAVVLWFVISKLNIIIISKYFPGKQWALLFYISTFFIWFVPFLSVRFSSENYAEITMLLALYFFFKDNKSSRSLFVMGLFLGLSVLFRYQMAIVVIVMCCWLIFKNSISFSKLLVPIAAFAIVIITGIFLDYLFYNEFVLTAINYLKLNIMEGKAATYGTSAWWYYIVEFLLEAIPPVSIFLLAFFLFGVYKLKNDLLSWLIIPFILIHFFISHKELRFLFPVSYLFVFIAVYGAMEYFKHRRVKKYHIVLFKFTVAINLILLAVVMFKPADETIANYKYLYNNINIGKRTIISLENENYHLRAGLKSTYYAPANYRSYSVNGEDKLSDFLNKKQIDTCFLVYGKFNFTGCIKDYNIKKVYSDYPDWLNNITWVDWQKVLNTHGVFLITKVRS